jgi:dihydropteroate synthase
VITLADLASLHADHVDDLARPVEPVDLGAGVVVGDGAVTIMGCINLSRDSTYRESIAASPEAALRMGRVQVAQGATILDVGAEASHATAARVSAAEQRDALVPVVRSLVDELGERAVVSVETYSPEVVEACLEAGARLLNMTGREHEDEMLRLAAAYDAGVVLCYGQAPNVRELEELPIDGDPLPGLVDHFAPRLERARELGVTRLLVDPGMGFSYGNLTDQLVKARHQTRVLAQCFRLRSLGVPVCTVLPHTLDLFEDEFRKAEGFYAVIAVLGGAQLLRIHEIAHVRVVLRALAELSV